jgi:hypothetical protein
MHCIPFLFLRCSDLSILAEVWSVKGDKIQTAWLELSGGRDSWGELIAVTLGKTPSSRLRFASGQRSTRALESKTPATINHWTES